MKQVKIYTTTYCGFCARAKDFLRSRGIFFEEIDVTYDDELRCKLEGLALGRKTVPQIFIGDASIGGYTDLMDLAAQGTLDDMLR